MASSSIEDELPENEDEPRFLIASSDEETEVPERELSHILEWSQKLTDIIVEVEEVLKIVVQKPFVNDIDDEKRKDIETNMKSLENDIDRLLDLIPDDPGSRRLRDVHLEIINDLKKNYVNMKNIFDLVLEVDRDDDGGPSAKRARSSHEHM